MEERKGEEGIGKNSSIGEDCFNEPCLTENEGKDRAAPEESYGLELDLDMGDAIKKIFCFWYQANPFYLISAGIVLFALTKFFGTENVWINTAIPLILIAVYTSLLTGTALLIVRAGKVWEDARSLIFIILVFFMALSVALDGIVLNNFTQAAVILPFALGFTLLLSEILRLGLRIRLGFLFKLPFFILISTFFLYPYLTGALVTYEFDRVAQIRSIFGFSVLMSALFLTLIPAIHRGIKYCENNGTPWKWPHFPWMIFAVLLVGTAFRVFFLCVSFISAKGYGPYWNMPTGFGLFMLIPLAISASILLLEQTLTLKRDLASRVLLAPLIFFILALLSPSGKSFLRYEYQIAILGEGFSPMALACVSAVAFYFYAWIRRVKFADFALAITFVLFAVFNPGEGGTLGSVETVKWTTFTPFWTASALIGIIAFFKRRSTWWFFTAICLTCAISIQFRNTFITKFHYAIPAHMIYFSIFTLGAIFKDNFARYLRIMAAILLPAMFATTLILHRFLASATHPGVVAVYLLILLLISATGFIFLKEKIYFIVGLINLAQLTLFSAFHAYRSVSSLELVGVSYLCWGAAFFFVALSISLFKGGVLQKISVKSWRQLEKMLGT